MLQLVSFERAFDDMSQSMRLRMQNGAEVLTCLAELESWSLPAKILPSNLSTSIGALRQYLANPPSLEADPKQLIQKKRKRRPRLARGGSDDEDGEEEDDGGLPRRQRQRKKKVAEVQNYKSAAFIDDSDDEDEEADRAFFEKERQLRDRMMRVAEEQAGRMMREVQDKKGKRKAVAVASEEGGAPTPAGQSDDVHDADSGSEGDHSGSSEVDDSSEDEGGRKRSRRQRKRRRSSQPMGDDTDQEADTTRSKAPLSEQMIGSDSD